MSTKNQKPTDDLGIEIDEELSPEDLKNSGHSIETLKRLLKKRKQAKEARREDTEAKKKKPKTGERKPAGKRKASFLGEDTKHLGRKRRIIEQDGHRKFAKVHAREHPDDLMSVAPEGELQNTILQHPWLDGQRFDGIDPNLNPEPPLNTAARREFDNERREQEMEKQLRLGNMPKFTNAPKPSPR